MYLSRTSANDGYDVNIWFTTESIIRCQIIIKLNYMIYNITQHFFWQYESNPQNLSHVIPLSWETFGNHHIIWNMIQANILIEELIIYVMFFFIEYNFIFILRHLCPCRISGNYEGNNIRNIYEWINNRLFLFTQIIMYC